MLRGEKNQRGKPVLSTYGVGNHSITDGRFRFIRYRNGDEELYDLDRDRFEWTNLAGDARYDYVKATLARLLPTSDAPEIEPARPWDGSELNEAAFKKFAPRRTPAPTNR